MNSSAILKMTCVNLLPYSSKLRGDFHRTLLYSINLNKRMFISSAREFFKINERHFKPEISRFTFPGNFRAISTSAVDKENFSFNLEKLDYMSVVDQCIKLLRRNNVEEKNLTACDILNKLSKLPGISPEQRVQLAESLINSLKAENVTLTERHYIGLLKCYIESKYLDRMMLLLDQMISDGIQPSSQFCLLMLKCHTENGNFEEMKTMIDNLEKQGIKSDEFFGSLIYDVVISRGLNDALDEVEILKSKNIPVGSYIYTSLLKGAITNEDTDQLQKLSDDIFITNTEFSEDQIFSLIETAILNNKCHLLKMLQICQGTVLVNIGESIVMKFLHYKGMEYASSALQNIISLAESLPSDMQLSYIKNLCKKFLQQLDLIDCSLNDKIEICLQLKQRNGYEYAFEYLLQKNLSINDIKSSLLIFKAMYENNIDILPHYFWPLFIALKSRFGDRGIIEILHKMYEFNIFPDIDTMKLIIFPNMSRKTLPKIVLKLSNEKMNESLIKETYIEFALENGHFQECKKFLTDYPLSREINYDFLTNACEKALCEFPPNTEALTIVKMIDAFDPGRVIQKLLKIYDLNKIAILLELFYSNNMYIKDKTTVKRLLHAENIGGNIKAGVRQLLNSEITVKAKMPKDMKKKPSAYTTFQEIENAEIHLAELEAKNMRTLAQKMRLHKLYMQNQMFGKAIKMRNELRKCVDELELSAQYLIYFCKCATYEDDLDGAVHYYERLRREHPDIRLDAPKAVDLANYFFKKKRFREVTDVLQNVAIWKECAENFDRKIISFLREVASLGNIKLTTSVFNQFVQNDFLKLSANALHVFTKTYLDGNDLDGAVEEYMRIVGKYKAHSNLYLLAFKVLEGDRLDLFDKIIEFTEKTTYATHGHEFVEAIAHAGKMNILPRYLQQFGFDLDDENFLNYLGKKKYVTVIAFKNLIKAAFEMKNSYDNLTGIALRVIAETRDREGLLDLSAFLKENSVPVRRSERTQMFYLQDLFESVNVDCTARE